MKEQLLKGMKVGDATCKVHLDGYNLLPLLTGQTEESPRKEFFYFNDDSELSVSPPSTSSASSSPRSRSSRPARRPAASA